MWPQNFFECGSRLEGTDQTPPPHIAVGVLDLVNVSLTGTVVVHVVG